MLQMNEILNLRGEVKQLSSVAQQLEPYIKSLSASLQQIPQKQSDAHKHSETQQVTKAFLLSWKFPSIFFTCIVNQKYLCKSQPTSGSRVNFSKETFGCLFVLKYR